MSALLNGMKETTNFGYTENGATKHLSTLDKVLDLFAMGGAYRNRVEHDIKTLFGDAYRQDPTLATKCLFYLRDVRGGQGERKFFRWGYHWLMWNAPTKDTALKNLNLIPEFGRWDDLIWVWWEAPEGEIKDTAFEIIREQLAIDVVSNTPSLLGKWMPSENASSYQTKEKAKALTKALGWTPKIYRQVLSGLRKKINVLERLMSANEWDKIEFDKIPSKAGMKYRNAFAVKEVTAARYKAFMENKETKVNAGVLNPVDIVDKIINAKGPYWNIDYSFFNEVEINTLQKYWDNLKDYYQGREENAIAIVDVSGSMSGTPMAAAIGMGAYVAQKSHGPFANHFITFSSNPQLVEFEGDDIVDKVLRCQKAGWGMNTDVERAMDLILNTAIRNKLSQDDLPARLYIFSDMEFDSAVRISRWDEDADQQRLTLFEGIEKKWNRAGYKMPKVTFWNLQARTRNIPAIGDSFNYISGFSMSQMEAVMAGKSAIDMMLDVLNGERYEAVTA